MRKLGGGRDAHTNHLCERMQWYFPKQRKKRRIDHVPCSCLNYISVTSVAPAPSPLVVNEILASIGEMHRDLSCLEVSPVVATWVPVPLHSSLLIWFSRELFGCNCLIMNSVWSSSFAWIVLVLVSLVLTNTIWPSFLLMKAWLRETKKNIWKDRLLTFIRPTSAF